MPRFVILFHEMPAGGDRSSHWDLMLESDIGLLTWALEHEPCVNAEINALELSEHRKEYLDYEGPVSNNRGTVSRWDLGHIEQLSRSPDQIKIKLEGKKIRGIAQLNRQERECRRWSLVISETPADRPS